MHLGIRRALLPLGLVVLTGCASDWRRENSEFVARLAEQHEQYMREFREAQEELKRHTYLPQHRDFGAAGTILVRECYLAGRPGKEALRLTFTYVNTTERAIDTARITLTLRDPDTQTEYYEVMDLRLPYKFSLTPDSSYTTWFDVPTRGLHLHPSWSWDIGVEALHEAGAP